MASSSEESDLEKKKQRVSKMVSSSEESDIINESKEEDHSVKPYKALVDAEVQIKVSRGGLLVPLLSQKENTTLRIQESLATCPWCCKRFLEAKC